MGGEPVLRLFLLLLLLTCNPSTLINTVRSGREAGVNNVGKSVEVVGTEEEDDGDK